MTSRRALAERIASADPAGLLYGGIVTAAVLAIVSASGESIEHVAVATTGALGVYWLSHVYVASQAMQYRGDDRHVHVRIGTAAVHELSVLKGGAPALVVYVLGSALGADKSNAALLALGFSVVFLATVGYLGAHRAGMTGLWALAEAAVAGGFGVIAALGKVLLH